MKQGLRLFLWMVLLTGVAYPLIITLVAQLIMHDKAQGGILVDKERTVGARLIAQKFEDAKYFWPRPSAVDYNPLPSGGSNYGPTSAALKHLVDERRSRFSKKDVPTELLYASGSGLDPHLSPEAVYFQVERVAKARGLDPKALEPLIQKQIKGRSFGFLGEPCINVLLLNRALDDLK
jgi:K+-transporting ATPase ATPase C chain